MTDLASFVARADAYAASVGVARSTVSKKLFRDTDTLDKLSDGWEGLGIGTFKQAIRRLTRLEQGLPPDPPEEDAEPEGAAA